MKIKALVRSEHAAGVMGRVNVVEVVIDRDAAGHSVRMETTGELCKVKHFLFDTVRQLIEDELRREAGVPKLNAMVANADYPRPPDLSEERIYGTRPPMPPDRG